MPYVLLMLGSGLLLAGVPERVAAQAPPVSVDSVGHAAAWRLVVDGEVTPWPEVPAHPLDSLRAVARRAVTALQRRGYYLARLDSTVLDTSAAAPTVHLYVRRGPRVPVGTIRFEGVAAFEEEAIRRQMYTRPGQPLDPRQLEADLETLLAQYEAAGYPLAQVRVAEARVRPGDSPTLGLVIAVDEGRTLRLGNVEVVGERTRPAYVARAAGLRLGQQLTHYDPEAIRERLRATDLFEEVERPELRVDGEVATVRIAVEEAPPGTFDLVLGYLPPAPEGRRGHLVGSGHLALENLFGGGRRLSLRLDRRPGRVSSAEVRAADPYFLGWPFGVEAHFSGMQEDSTYGKRSYGLQLGHHLGRGMRLFGTFSREVTRPGQTDAGVPAGAPPRAEAWFGGVGLELRRLDRSLNPRRGVQVEVRVAQGRKVQALRQPAAGGAGTRAERRTLRQGRIEGCGRLFLPTLPRQLVVLGAEGAFLTSAAYDLSDLFRLGGATSLRGYDEDRFRGRGVGRALVEYRYQAGPRSYAHAFFDLGYVETPPLAEDAPLRRSLHAGYGLGVRFDTRFGLVDVSYALNPRDRNPMDGRVHLGLSLGL